MEAEAIFGSFARTCRLFSQQRLSIFNHTQESHARCSAEFRVGRKTDPVLSLVVWTLKREVRAIRGCLGMYRR